MKKKKILLLIVVVLICVWTIYRSIVPSYSSVLEANWGIELPIKALCKEVYEAYTGASFHGDGVRYHVFSYKNSAPIEQMLPWSDVNGNTLAWSQTEGEEKRYQTYREATDLWLSELEIPQEQYPEYDSCFCWYKNEHDNSEIIVFWNPEINRLYIVENII
jgi:hypothetical protein